MRRIDNNQQFIPDLIDIVENIPLGILVINTAGIISYYNNNFLNLFELKSAQPKIGKSFKSLIPKKHHSFILDNINTFQKNHHTKPKDGSIFLKLKNNKQRVLRWELKKYPQKSKQDISLICTIQDITLEYEERLSLKQGRQEAEKVSSTNANYLNRVISSMPCNVWWSDLNSNFLGGNEIAAKACGYLSTEEFIGKNGDDIAKRLNWTEGQAKKFRESDLTVMLSGEPTLNVLEPPIQMSDGRLVHYMSNKVPLRDENNKIIGIIGVSIDVTERVEMEQQLRHANERAEIATQAKLDFLANFSHELRTPLNGILGITSILSQQPLTDDQKLLIGDITYSGQILLGLVNDILDISKIESNKLVFNETNFQLSNSIEEVSSQLKHQAHIKGIKFIQEISPDLKVSISTDEQRFKQILINLISNAIKFTDTGYVKLVAEKTKSTKSHIWYTISVEDTGIGISPDNAEKIFDRYSQFSSAYTKSHPGTGLGLNIVKSLVNMMGGDITVKSQLNNGSTFTIHLKSRTTSSDFTHQNLSTIAKNVSIFIIDDNLESGERLLKYFHEFETQLSSSNRAIEILCENAKRSIFSNMIIISDDIKKNNIPKLVKLINNNHTLKYPIQLIYTDKKHFEGKKPRGVEGILSSHYTDKQFSDAIHKAYDTYLKHQEKMTSNLREKAFKILLVEDNYINQKVITIMLTNLGCVVDVAGDCDSALRLFKSKSFDLVFMDIGLPGKDGFEVTKLIRALEPRNTNFPIIAMTAYASEEDKKKCLDVGMNDYMSKPLDQQMIASALSLWLVTKAKQRQ